MAVTEKNQWLHILLILFVMLAIAGGVGTYLGVTAAYTAEEKRAEAEKDLKQKEQYLQAADQVKETVLAYTGAGATSITIDVAHGNVDNLVRNGEANDVIRDQYANPVKAIRDAYEDDMKDVPDNITTWRALATFLTTTVSKKNKTIQEKDDQIRRTRSEAESKIKEAEDKTVVAENKAAAAEKALDDAKIAFAKTVNDLNTQLAALKTSTNQNLVVVQEKLQKVQDVDKQLRDVIASREKTISIQSNIIENYRRTDFDIPDGRVTSVNAASRIVWINLGYLDVLPNQLKFSVYDSQAAELNETAKKGEIKIQRIVGPHTAEAIITEKDEANPILADDFVFTSTWTPGQRTKYYLAGKFDLDGDGKSDQERVKALLIRSGGMIVGELKQDGSRAGGEIDPNIRYLVYGGKPDNGTLADEVDKVRKEAIAEGVKSIGVDLLLTNLGLGSEARVISGGAEVESGFQKRRPPRIGN